MDQLTGPAVRERARAIVETSPGRHVTAEWLAGRVGAPVWVCESVLDELAVEGVVRRRGTTYEVPLPRSVRLRRILLALAALAASVGVVAAGSLQNHVFYFAMGLALGLMIAFAWLDWELRARS